MNQRNDGLGEINSFQNHFTAYLLKAERRCKDKYLTAQSKLSGTSHHPFNMYRHLREVSTGT